MVFVVWCLGLEVCDLVCGLWDFLFGVVGLRFQGLRFGGFGWAQTSCWISRASLKHFSSLPDRT